MSYGTTEQLSFLVRGKPRNRQREPRRNTQEALRGRQYSVRGFPLNHES